MTSLIRVSDVDTLFITIHAFLIVLHTVSRANYGIEALPDLCSFQTPSCTSKDPLPPPVPVFMIVALPTCGAGIVLVRSPANSLTLLPFYDDLDLHQ